MELHDAIKHLNTHIAIEENGSLETQAWIVVKENLRWLNCLEAAGVDNWEGYDIAAVQYNKE